MAADRLTHLIEAYNRLDEIRNSLEKESYNAADMNIKNGVQTQLRLTVEDLETVLDWLDEDIQKERNAK